jgi:hypothetical protein
MLDQDALLGRQVRIPDRLDNGSDACSLGTGAQGSGFPNAPVLNQNGTYWDDAHLKWTNLIKSNRLPEIQLHKDIPYPEKR